MSCASATFDQVSPFDAFAQSFGAYSRAAFRGITATIVTAVIACVAAGVITMAAAWIVSNATSINTHVFATSPGGMETIAVGDPYRMRSDAGYRIGTARFVSTPIYAIEPITVAEPSRAPSGVSAPSAASREPEQTTSMLAPPSGQLEGSLDVKPQDVTFFAIVEDPPRTAVTNSVPPKSVLQASLPPKPADEKTLRFPELTGRTAIYDIKAHTVYLPNGQKLEAHSGLGHRRDNPQYVGVKNKGPTPPNVYNLKMRESLFHGIRAIRLNPAPGSKMFGRDGILAHTYMLGPTGQSFGCVSFKNYQAFLRAFLNGEVDRIVVVPQLDDAPAALAAIRRGSSEQ